MVIAVGVVLVAAGAPQLQALAAGGVDRGGLPPGVALPILHPPGPGVRVDGRERGSIVRARGGEAALGGVGGARGQQRPVFHPVAMDQHVVPMVLNSGYWAGSG